MRGIGEALEGEAAVGLRGHPGQHNRHAQALGHRVNHLLPGRLQVVAFGSQRRRGFWSQLEGSPGDLHVTVLDRVRERLLSEIAEWADEIREHLNCGKHTTPFRRVVVVLQLAPVTSTGPKVVTDISVIGTAAPGLEPRCAPGCR